jgi:hypothetical protein
VLENKGRAARRAKIKPAGWPRPTPMPVASALTRAPDGADLQPADVRPTFSVLF